jgi:hypothetical protein
MREKLLQVRLTTREGVSGPPRMTTLNVRDASSTALAIALVTKVARKVAVAPYDPLKDTG